MQFNVRTIFATALVLLAAATRIDGARIVVPDDYTDLQTAINNALPGDLVMVRGGTWNPIVIDKELTLLGNPTATIRPFVIGPVAHPPLIELRGPGQGRVVIANIDTGGNISGFFHGSYGAAIFGGGFDELWIYDSRIETPTWTGLTGVGFGAPGIDVSIPLIGLSETRVVGGNDLGDECIVFGGIGYEGVLAPRSTLIALNTAISGGPGDIVCLDTHGCDPSAAGPNWGGHGVVVDRILHASCSLQGGQGGAIFCGGVEVARSVDGVPVMARGERQLTTSLLGPDPVLMGGTWSFEYKVQGNPSMLWVAATPRAPVRVHPYGTIFFNPREALHAELLPGGGLFTHTLDVPVERSLFGLEVVVQIWDTDSVSTNPLMKVIR